MSSLTRKIGDVAKVKGGKRLPKGVSVLDKATGHPYLRVVDFADGGIDHSDIKYIDSKTFDYIKRYTIDSSDIYISIAGTIGRVGVVPDNLTEANLTENAAKITKISDDIDHRYLMYYLRSPVGQGAIKNRTGGTSQPKLALYKIADIDFPCRPLATQQRIAFILSAYDDLIENNRRRIQLLEESARLLYREWFVRLRFPGHKHVKIIKCVPEGWEKSALGDNIVLNYGKALKADDRIEGKYPVYGSSGIVGTHKKLLVKGPGIIVGRKGNVGSVFWSSKDFNPIDTVYYIDAESSDYYLYNALQNMQFVNSDAAVPGLNRNYAYSRPYLLPLETIRSHFENTVAPIYGQIFKLDDYNEKLKQARDLLLPRLMNGEIEV
ncbi:MAG: restriction endonuclease subunit S [Syntrophobacterales bacterium]|nr:restriction endonuclease subunit S [Syntrophobacterales bacterium]